MALHGPIDVNQLAEELATFATGLEDHLPAQGTDQSTEETTDHITDKEELYYSRRTANSLNADGNISSNIHIFILCQAHVDTRV